MSVCSSTASAFNNSLRVARAANEVDVLEGARGSVVVSGGGASVDLIYFF